MKLYLIRHGQTDWNIAHRIQGRQDIELNEMGRRQAERLAEAMKSRPVTAIFSSPQKRAWHTAKAVQGVWQVPLMTLPQLMEIGYGSWEGRTSEDILSTDRELYEAWWKHPAQVAPPGGETLAQVDGRCRAAWDQIRSQITGDTAIVSHGGTLAHLLVCLLKGASGGEADGIVVENASITTIEYDPAAGVCSLVQLNDSSHLGGYENFLSSSTRFSK
ncbi:MAG: histidine phosphatase family protein [Clostridiales bacterium]|nr:histidine phosphatase family protein [Clostridiales bacterium]